MAAKQGVHRKLEWQSVLGETVSGLVLLPADLSDRGVPLAVVALLDPGVDLTLGPGFAGRVRR